MICIDTVDAAMRKLAPNVKAGTEVVIKDNDRQYRWQFDGQTVKVSNRKRLTVEELFEETP